MHGFSVHFLLLSPQHLRSGRSRVRWRVSPHPTPSLRPLPCALGALSAPNTFATVAPVCAGGLLRTQHSRSGRSRVRWRLFPHPSPSPWSLPCALELSSHPTPSLRPLPCALRALSAPSTLAPAAPVCSGGPLRTQHLRFGLSRVRWRPSPHPTPSLWLLPCALEALSAPSTFAPVAPVCAGGPFRTQHLRFGLSCVRWRPSPHPAPSLRLLPCALEALSAPKSLTLVAPVCKTKGFCPQLKIFLLPTNNLTTFQQPIYYYEKLIKASFLLRERKPTKLIFLIKRTFLSSVYKRRRDPDDFYF